MNMKNFWIIVFSFIVVLYALFLIVPFGLNGLMNSYNDEIAKIVEESSGFKLQLGNIRLVTTPKLTAGVHIGELILSQPDDVEIINIKNADVKLSLLPLLIKRIEADIVRAEKINISLKVQKDGKFLVENYMPEPQEDNTEPAMSSLPYGFKLSNHLPDVKIKEYNITLVDMRNNKNYSLNGKNFQISNFILNKKLRVSADGSVNFDGASPFNYNIKVFNRIMPDIELNDLVFGQTTSASQPQQPIAFNIIDIFENIKKNQITADVKADVKTSGTLEDMQIDGLLDVEHLSLAVNGKPLPAGHVKVNFKGKKHVSDVILYTAENEATSLVGEINTKSKKVSLAFKSNAKINNIFNIIKSLASSLNYNDLETLSATGAIDADFSIKSNTKHITSSGYFNIPSAAVKYGLYNILIDKINANLDFAGDKLDVKNIGFQILSQPMKAYGTINSDTTTDLHLKAERLSLKGLLLAAGQLSLLKDNDIKSGTLSVDASLTGNFKEIKPNANILVQKLEVLNKPSALLVKLPNAKATIDTKDVTIDDTYLLFNNSRIDVSGKVSDYLAKNPAFNLEAGGKIIANDLKNMLPVQNRSMVSAKGAMPLKITASGNDKKQVVVAQLLATPSGYFHIADVPALSGKSTLITSTITVDGNALKFSDSGLYATSASVLPVSVSSAAPLAVLTGKIKELSNPQVNINISTPSVQTLSVPGFSKSKLLADADINVKGSFEAPILNGHISLPEISIPTMKTSIKNSKIVLGAKSIDANFPSIKIDNSTMSAKTLISPNFSNGVLVRDVDFKADLIDADTLAGALAGSSSNTQTSSSNASQADLGVVIQHGKGTVTKFKSGNIVATNLSSDFGLKNNIFSLKNIKGDAFGGKINGDISVNAISGKTSVKMTGSEMKAVAAIEGAAAIPNALSGLLGFNADLKLNAFAPSYNLLLKSVTGDVSFNVKNGHYANIGRLDNLLLAQNLAANAILKTALIPIRNMPIVQNTSEFSSITGNLSLKNGVANLKSVKSAGPSMAYFVTGNYNLLSGYTNVIILGRLGADVVAALGPLGQLSVNKLTAYIPKFGTQTAAIINALTSNPATEKTSQIPALSTGSTNTRDFKVVFTGNVTSAASIKSFKWLTTCDTSGITGGSLKDQFKSSTNAIKNSGTSTVQDVKKSAEAVKDAAKNTAEDVKNQVQRTKDSIKELKNLKNMFKSPTSAQ